MRLHYILAGVILLWACSKKNPVQQTQATGNILVKVKNTAGLPLDSTTVTTSPFVATATTNSIGEATFSNLAVGDYGVIAKRNGYLPDTIQARVNADQTTATQMILQQDIPPISLTLLKNYRNNRDEHFEEILVAQDGAVYLIGQFELLSRNFFIRKINSSGDVLLEKPFQANEINDAIVLADGSIVAVGDTDEPNSNFADDMLLIKFDANGDEVLRKTYDQYHGSFESGYSVVVLTNGFVVGNDSGDLFGITNDGTVLWRKNYNYGGAVRWAELILTRDGNISGTGWAGDKLVVGKYTGNGDEIWYKKLGFGESYGTWLEEIADGSILVSGSTNVNLNVVPHRGDIYLAKLDPSGNLLFEKALSTGNYFDDGCAAFSLYNGDILVLGDTQAFEQGDFYDIWAVRTTNLGAILFQNHFGTTRDEICNSAVRLNEKEFALAGYHRDNDRKSHGLFMKIRVQ